MLSSQQFQNSAENWNKTKMKTRKQIISEALLEGLKGLGAFVTPDFSARQALAMGWSKPRIRGKRGYTPSEVLDRKPEVYDPILAYMNANAKSTLDLYAQKPKHKQEEEKIQHKLDRRQKGLVRLLRRIRAINPDARVGEANIAIEANTLHRELHPQKFGSTD